ncbi:B-cell linker protein [Trichomycterus rosablanca]|uniref:B-cell linker protein n=1 Tax=Trichomycterus rosablanca TaxID=2290929 RepID=UPI002F35A458
MEKLNKVTAPAGEKLRQLQKIVQDIKKNDDSILNRWRRFQSEQTANFLKTSRNTLERIKNKPPKVPARDYPGDDADSAHSSDSEFDFYEDPQGDDNYEPPPCDKVFNHSSPITYPTGEYLDSHPGRLSLPKSNKPFLPFKPSGPEKPKQSSMCDEDYMDPQEDTDDNYIDPTEQDSSVTQERSCSPDVYEVPDMDDSLRGCSTTLRPPAVKLPPKASPRTNIRKPAPCTEPEDECDYEICNGDDEPEEPEKEADERPPSIPVPLPREKNKKPPLFQKPSLPAKDHKASATNRTQDSATSIPNPTSTGFHIINRRMPMQREIACQRSPAGRGSLSQEDSATRQQEEEAGVYKQPWYAGSTDRKKAEDALMRSAMDGSYLLRKSSGVDALQPYTLVVFYNGRVYNIPVRYIPTTKQYALGKHKNGEERFKTVSDMIENHQRNALVLVDTQSNTKDSTKLKHAVKP